MQKKEITFYIITILLACITFVLDLFIDVDISLVETNVIGTAVSFLTIIFSLWFSYLLVVKQIYSNRYSSKVVGKHIYSGRTRLTIHFFALLLCGFFLMIFADTYVVFSIYFVINCVIFVFLCGKNIYKKISEEEIRKAVTDKVEIILSEMDKNLDSKKVSSELNKLLSIYNDAYLKNEIDICKSILMAYYNFFKKFIEDRNKNILQDGAQTKKIVDALLAFQHSLLKGDSSSCATELNGRILHTLYDLSEICIKCDIESILVDLLEAFYHVSIIDNKKTELMLEDIYVYIHRLEIKAVDLDKEVLFDTILEGAKRIFYSLKFEMGKGNYIAFFRHFVLSLIACLEKDRVRYYKKLYSDFNRSIISEISLDNSENICILVSMLLNKDIVKNSSCAKQDLLELMKKLASNKTIYSDRFFSFVRYVVEKFKEMGENDGAFNLQYLYAKNIVEHMSDAPNYIFPEFSEKMKEFSNNYTKNEELCEKLKVLLGKSIDKNKVNWVGLLLTEVIECLKQTQQKDKDIQIIWINLFQDSAERASLSNNLIMQEMVIRYYEYAIFEMDKLKIISKDLGVKIIDYLRVLCESRYRENLDFTCRIIELLDNFLNKDNNLHFINAHRDLRDRVFVSLFNIAVDSIEKNQDLVIKRVSNIIGWQIKKMIEGGNNDAAEVLIDYAIQIFNLCKANKINHQTIVFIGTLFIIIGAYTSTNAKLYKYRYKIIKGLKFDSKNKEYLEVSKQLRQCETLGWKDLLGENPRIVINKFWEEYSRSIQ